MKCVAKIFMDEANCGCGKIVKCKECWFREISDGNLYCTNPNNGGWRKRNENDFCSFAKEGTYEAEKKEK